MSTPATCAICRQPLTGRRTHWSVSGRHFTLCPECAARPMAERQAALAPELRAAGREARAAAETARRQEQARRLRTDVPEHELEERLLHAFLDLITERRIKGRAEFAITIANLSQLLAERTGLNVHPRMVQQFVLDLQAGGIITIGGGGIGTPNRYATREDEMGTAAFWDQVDAFLMVYKLPGRLSLLELPG